jgi:K+-sensing histidine kinase KdpD
VSAREAEAYEVVTSPEDFPSRAPAPSGTIAIRRPDVALLLAHDLKTPLATIAMNLEFALDEAASLSASTREALEDCLAANARAVRVVSDMADAARIARDGPRLNLQVVDVHPLLGEAVRHLEREVAARHAHVTVRGEPTISHCDRALLATALERLLEWTVRHVQGDGAVEVRCLDRVVSMRTGPAGPGAKPASSPVSLATHYADTVMRSQGGGVWTEIDPDGSLCVTVALPP